jgi:hypothetical protein
MQWVAEASKPKLFDCPLSSQWKVPYLGNPVDSTPATLAEPLSRSTKAVAVGLAVRDPNVQEILLALIRLNRMRVQALGIPPLEVEIAPPGAETSLLVGYIASDEDAEYFEDALRRAGNLPSVVLVPRDTEARLLQKVTQRLTKVVKLPEGAQAIANAIRDELVATAGPTMKPENRLPTGLGDSK